MDSVDIIGMLGGTLISIAFIPQTIKMIRLKDAKSISYISYLLFLFGSLSWVIYGFIIQRPPVVIFNFVTVITSSLILYYKYKFSRNTSNDI